MEYRKNPKRYKKADAIASEFIITCPYKVCGYMNLYPHKGLRKGEIFHCINCRKGIRIRRVI